MSDTECTEYVDKVLRCVECEAEFTWTNGEQRYFADHKLLFAPKRCRACRDERKRQREGGGVRVVPAPVLDHDR